MGYGGPLGVICFEIHQTVFNFINLFLQHPLLALFGNGNPLELTVHNDNGVIVAGGNAGAELLAVVGFKVLLDRHQHIGSRIELQKLLPQASLKMLAQQLKELERDGLVHRELYPVVPPKTEYSLTERGKTLAPIILAIYQWGEQLFVDAGLSNPCNPEDIVRMKVIVENGTEA